MRLIDDLKYNFKKQDNGLMKLILINVIVFVFFAIIFVFSHLFNSPEIIDFIERNAYLPASFDQFIRKPWTLITYFFTHSLTRILHILFNMLMLYWFGKIIEEYVGSRRLINIYILGGITGGVLYLLLYNLLPFFEVRAENTVLLGASGAVLAIATAAATLVPDHTFYLILIGPVRIVYIVAFLIFLSFLQSVGENAGGEICHLGGALLGFVYIRMLRRGKDLGQPINVLGSWIRRFNRPKMKVSYRKKQDSEITQQEIDAILDKINRTGYTSLTKEEKQKLFKASQK